LNSLTRSGPGSTLLLQTAAANSLNAATNYDRIIVNNPPTPVNGMVAPYIVNATDNTFVTYGVNGFANVTYDTTVGAGTFPAGLAPTAKVDVNFTGGVALTDNPVVYALRTNRDINLGGPFNTVTIRSGGLIGHANALTINSNLVFNDGAANVEALIHTGNTVNINGTITADGIVKSGNANLSINVPQTGYSSGWTVNSGTLQINDLGGLGQSVPTNTVTLNASLNTGGQASQAFGITNLTFNRNQGTPELQTFTGGPITVFNEGTIRVAGGDDRNLQIPAVTLDSTGTDSSVAFTYDVPNNRYRANIPNLTLNDDAIIRVTDSGATTDTGRITTGAVGQLTGNGKDLVKIGNRTLELTNDNSASFIGGSITVSQGTIRVRTNGSLGSATTATQIERNATLEIDTTNFTPAGPVVQLPGSIERWNREDARGTTHNLPAGVNLQLNTNLNSTRTIGLNGGSLEAFLWTDHPLTAVERTVGSAVTINLLANSSVGQNVIQGQGYDAGRQPVTGQPFGDTLGGAYLRIDGNITGNFDLTKTGFDTVTIAGAANTYRNTIVDLGSLRLGRANALPTTGVLTTRLNGTLDLYGNNQVVAGLGTANAGPNLDGTGVGSSGRITNSATTSNTLLVNSVADFTYNGVIEQNVALTKAGGGSLTLGGANTYSGDTDIINGTLVVTGSLTGTALINVGAGATLNVAAAAGGFVLGADQTLAGEGTVVGNVAFDGLVSPGSSPGVLTLNGTATFNTGSTFALEVDSAVAFDKLIATSTSLNGAVNLTLSLGYTPLQNTQFMVLENTGIAPIGGSSGLFTWGGPEGMLTEGEEFVVGASTFSITYAGGAGSNDVVLTAVPEPVSGVMLLGGLALLTARRRRQS
jgi:autotransporter-associated beta strand protein